MGTKFRILPSKWLNSNLVEGKLTKNYNLWNKAEKFFNTIKTQLKSEETILCLQSYYDFDITGRNIPQNCRVIKGEDFKNCIFPFDLLQTRDLDLSKELFRKYFQKLGIDIKTISLFGKYKHIFQTIP